MICKFYQAPPERDNDGYYFYHNGVKQRAGPWKGELKGWCRYIAPKKRYSDYDPCLYSNDEKIECPLKGLP